MDRNKFNEELKKIGYDYRKNQYEFYSNIHNFLKGDKQIMIARGGMGLGKTITTSLAFKNFLPLKNGFVYVATPYSKIKGNWCKELNLLELQKRFVEWVSKKDCIPLFYHKDTNDCKDDCEHRKHLEKRKDGYTEYSDLCVSIFNNLNFPLIASDWYKKRGTKDCLLSMIRYGIKYCDIKVGDYIPIINHKILNYVLFNEIDVSRRNSILVLDEAHKLPERAESFFSKTFNLTQCLNQIEKKHEKSKIGFGDIYWTLENGLKVLKKIEEQLLKKFEELNKNNSSIFKKAQLSYSFTEFKNHFNSFNQISFNNFLETLSIAKKKLSSTEYEDEENDPYLKRLYIFLYNWNEISQEDNKNYTPYFQYLNYEDSKKYVSIRLVCNNVKEKIRDLLLDWKKVILLSGTIHESYSDSIGFDKSEVDYPNELNSFTIKDDVLIYSRPYKERHDFIFNNIQTTLNKDKKLINLILKKIKGRTLIFVSSKKVSNFFESILEDCNVYNLCNYTGDEYKIKVEEFSNEKNAVAILNLRGKVEGTNFIDDDGNTIENLIIYGYSYNVPNLEYKDREDFLANKYNNRIRAKAELTFIPVGNIIHQACCRAKRDENDKPLILLIGDMYQSHRNEFQYLPHDIQEGFQCSDKEILLNKIGEMKKENDKRDI